MSEIKTIELLKQNLENVGYTVGLNKPMTGGKVLRKYHKENKS